MSNRPYADRKADFYRVMQIAAENGIPHPEIIAAQWALESDWGDKVTGQHNYFGVKAGNGDPNNNLPGTVSMTHEVLNGKRVQMPQKFRDYDTMDAAIIDRGNFTNKAGGRYEKAGYHTAPTPYAAAQALQRAGYATDPHYADQLGQVMRGVGVDPYATGHNGAEMTMRYNPEDPFNVLT